MPFADMWHFHPRDIDRMTLAEFTQFRAAVDVRFAEAKREAKRAERASRG